MSYKPVYGYSGDGPIFVDFGGGDKRPVMMESPNPHPPWSFLDNGSSGGASSVTAGTIRFDADGSLNNVAASLRVYLVYTGVPNLNVEIATSMDYALADISTHSSFGDETGLLYITKANPTPDPLHPSSGTILVPWYRYRFTVSIQGTKTGMTASDYIEITIT